MAKKKRESPHLVILPKPFDLIAHLDIKAEAKKFNVPPERALEIAREVVEQWFLEVLAHRAQGRPESYFGDRLINY